MMAPSIASPFAGRLSHPLGVGEVLGSHARVDDGMPVGVPTSFVQLEGDGMSDQLRGRSGPPREGSSFRDDRFLRYAAFLYAAGLVLHLADHLRRGLDVITPEVQWAGYASTAVGLITIALVLTGRWAPMAAAATGFSIALGVAAVHLLPRWSVFSDAFPAAQDTGVTPLSWAVVLIEIVGAFALGLAAASALRGSGRMGNPQTV